MRNPVHDYAVSRGFAHARPAKLYKFRSHAIFRTELVHPGDKRRGKAIFPPAEKANLFHVFCSCKGLREVPRLLRFQFTACAEEVRGSVTPPRVSETRCRTTAFISA